MTFPAQSLLWMDIEGYEGHALEGAKSLLSSGIPLVSEFNPEFLAKAGGLEAFKQALEGRRIFDLQEDNQSPTTLTDITRRLSVKGKIFNGLTSLPSTDHCKVMPLLSIVIPTHKRPRLVARAIASAINAYKGRYRSPRDPERPRRHMEGRCGSVCA